MKKAWCMSKAYLKDNVFACEFHKRYISQIIQKHQISLNMATTTSKVLMSFYVDILNCNRQVMESIGRTHIISFSAGTFCTPKNEIRQMFEIQKIQLKITNYNRRIRAIVIWSLTYSWAAKSLP